LIGCSMSVTDTKEFIRMETAADKLGVDPVKLVRMMQDKKMMVRIEFPADRFEKIKWAIYGKKMWENEPDEHLIGDLIVTTLEGMEVLERHLLEGKTGIDLLVGLELCVETNSDVLLSIINRELGHPPPEISPNSENIIRAYSLPEALLEKIKEKRITQPRLVIQTHDFEQLKKLHTEIESTPDVLETLSDKSGKRKPHTAFIAHEMKANKKRGESWEKFKQLANDSVGRQQVELPGFGNIYLRRVRKNPEKEILYSHEPFDHDEVENIPIGVFLIKKTAFDTAWNDITHKGNIKET
jgi:hypothetical protein